VKERPIPFSTENVRAILEGRKTQTRRVITANNSEVGEGKVDWSKFCWDGSQIYRDTCRHGHTEEHSSPLPFVDGRANEYYPYEHQYLHVPYNWTEDMTIFRIYPKREPGDRLWVKEAFCRACELKDNIQDVCYREDLEREGHNCLTSEWKPSIFMPRWASRITLEITGVRAERLQDITIDNIIREGVRVNAINPEADIKYRGALYDNFRSLWDSLNAKRGYPWESNPWVWVIEFNAMGIRLK